MDDIWQRFDSVPEVALDGSDAEYGDAHLGGGGSPRSGCRPDMLPPTRFSAHHERAALSGPGSMWEASFAACHTLEHSLFEMDHASIYTFPLACWQMYRQLNTHPSRVPRQIRPKKIGHSNTVKFGLALAAWMPYVASLQS